MQFPAQDLTNQYISRSYQDVLQQYIPSNYLYVLDGLGNVVFGLPSASIGYTVITSDITSSMTVGSASVSTVINILQTTQSVSASWTSASRWSDTASFVQFGLSNITLTNDDIVLSATSSIASYTSQSVNIATDLSLFYTTNSGSVLGLINAGDNGTVSIGTLGNSSSVMMGIGGSGSLFSISTSDSSSVINVSANGVNSEINIETREVSSSIHIWTALQGSDITLENTAAMSTIHILSEHITIDKAFITGSLLGNVMGSASYAETASWAATASLTQTSSYLSGWNFNNTGSILSTIDTQIPIISLTTGSYIAAFFDYAIISESNVRAGTIFGAWVNGLISYTEASNVDVGNTSTVTMSFGIVDSSAVLSASVSTIPWTIKALGRYL